MSTPLACSRPQSLRLQIGSSPEFHSLSPATPSPLSYPTRREPWGYESPSGECYERVCTVIAIYDFSSSDPDHLSFRRHEILQIVRQERSGWWAAVRGDGSEVGWVPASYVRTLSDDAAHRVYDLRERTRIPELGVDPENFRSAPLSKHLIETPSSGTTFSDSESFDTSLMRPPSSSTTISDNFLDKSQVRPPSSSTTFSDNEPSDISQARALPFGCSAPATVTERSHDPAVSETEDRVRDSSPNSAHRRMEDLPAVPPSMSVEVPPVPQKPKPLRLDKSLPASPDVASTPCYPDADLRNVTHGRNSSESAISFPDRAQRRPLFLEGSSSIQSVTTMVRAQTSDHLPILFSPLGIPPSPFSHPLPPHAHSRPGKVLQLTGDDNAQAFHSAKQAQANLPWYLKHRHSEDEIKVDYDGTVQAGTLPALVEHLVVDPLRASQQETFRRAFLVTFRTFATATEVFDLLVAQYELDLPPNLSEEEFEQWKREKLRPTQKRVLTVLTMWLEEYDLLNQDPEVAPKLQAFLCLISSPATLASMAKHILRSLERLTFAEPSAPEAVVMSSKKWKKVRKGDGFELLRMDPLEVAQHLSLFESDLYRKVSPHECFIWSKVKEGDSVKNILAFCATHDRLADWVKYSILEVSVLGKRANVVDLWIRVAEKCKSLNNFSSMSSIVAALSSVLISRLHFTWVNSSRESTLEPLRKIIHPASNYGYYRNILDAVEGPCIPFAGPFLKNIIYAQEQHADNVFVQSATRPDTPFTLVQFVKRRKWYDITLQLLRFQTKPYHIPEIPEMTSFIAGQMDKAASMGERWYWQRSDELQHAELVHADIRRGLEAAGF